MAAPKKNRVLELMAKFEAEMDDDEVGSAMHSEPSTAPGTGPSGSLTDDSRSPVPPAYAPCPTPPSPLSPRGSGTRGAALQRSVVPSSRGAYGPQRAHGGLAPLSPRSAAAPPPVRSAYAAATPEPPPEPPRFAQNVMTADEFARLPRWTSAAVVMTERLVRQHADPDLVEVNLHYKSISKIERTPAMTKSLRYLDLSSNNIRVIENLQGLDGLRELRLDCCMLTEIPTLALPSLTVLNVDDNRIGEIKGLEKCLQLEELKVSANELVSFGCVPKLKHLKRLYVARNHIANVSGIETLTELDTLDLSRNGITSIPVGMLPSCLSDLILEGNNLSSGSFLFGKRSARARADHSEVLCGVPNLASLLLGGNEFRDMSTFPPVPSLLDLDLKNNKVESLRDIDDKVPNLEVLDVSGNYLKTLDQLSALDMLMALSDLTIEGNPVVEENTEGEVLESMAHFPALDHVNGRPFARGTMQRLGLSLEKSQLAHLQQELQGGAEKTPALAGGDRPPSAAGRPPPDLSTTLSLSRPGTSSSRPGTSSGRPGTSGGEGEQAEGVRKSAAHLEARGVKDPLMFARPQLSTKRCWNAEQVEQECTRVLRTAFDAGDRTTEKAYQEAESALQGMTAFLKQAEATLALEAKLQLERDEKNKNAPSTEGLPAHWGVDAYTKMHGDNPVQFRRPPAPATPEKSEESRAFEEELEAELDAALAARDHPFRASFVTEVVSSPMQPLEKPESPLRSSETAAPSDDEFSDADVDPPPASNDEFDAHPLLAPDELDATLGDLPEPDVLVLEDPGADDSLLNDSLQMSAPQNLEQRAAERAPRRSAPSTLAPVKPRKPSVQRKIQDAQSFAKSRTSGKASPRRARPSKPA